MSNTFDPYYEWLGIPPREQPVNHYRLLGLNLYETNIQVIANAADRQMSFIRTFQTGVHSKESQTILNEISKARVTLLNEARKREYDDTLRIQAFRGEVRSVTPPVPASSPVPPTDIFAPVPAPPPVPPTDIFAPNSNVQPVSVTESGRRKMGNRRNEATKKAKQSQILTASAVVFCFFVLLTIFILIASFSRTSPTLTVPPACEAVPVATSSDATQIIEEPPLRAGDRMVKTVNGVEFAFRWCPPGTFMMGGEREEWNGSSMSEKSDSHEVTLGQGFWMLETEVTQKQWQAIMENNPSYFKDDNLPVEQVSWNDCQDFCEKFNSISGVKTGLPTEAQWEYACRAGTMTAYGFGSSLNGDSANCNGNSSYGTTTKGTYLEKTTPVGSYSPNAWGLYDMHGNVREWCSDWYGDYPNGSVKDPMGAEDGTNRVLRGGSWYDYAGRCRSAYRDANTLDCRYYHIGFRLSLGQELP